MTPVTSSLSPELIDMKRWRVPMTHVSPGFVPSGVFDPRGARLPSTPRRENTAGCGASLAAVESW